MKLYRIDKGYRYLNRYREIVAVFGKYGFAHVFDRLNLALRIRILGRISKQKKTKPSMTVAARLRLALEELGPTFIKVGQLLSTRSFLLPAQFIEELTKLQDKVKPVEFDQVRQLINRELGDLDKVFTDFETIPIASASMALAYKATLLNGQKVVIKVQRPGLKRLVDVDMDILHDLASLLERHVEESRQYEPVSVIDELRRTMQRELDFTNEARNIESFSKNFEESRDIYVPRVFWEHTTAHVVTLEYIEGIKISKIGTLRERGFNLKKIANLGTRFIMRQIFIYGYFHADPHPGNLFMTYDGKIAPVDFGIVGRLDDWLMAKITDLLIAAWKRDIDLILRVLVDLGAISLDAETYMLRYELSDYLNRYYGLPLSKINMKLLVNDGFEIISRHRLKIPSNMMLLVKTIGTYEDLARKLDPDYNFVKHLRPYIKRLVLRRLDPEKLAYESSKSLRDLATLAHMAPREIELILRRIRRGQIAMELHHHGLDKITNQVDRSFNRLSFSLIIAAITVASSLIMMLDKGPLFLGYPFFGIFGYIIAGLLGLGLIVNILKSGRL